MTHSKLNHHIERYLQMIEKEEVRSCNKQKLLAKHVRKCFATEKLRVDGDRLEKYLGLAKYFPFERLFEWEVFCFALHFCVFRADGMPRWPDLLLVLGRGSGKDGYLAYEATAAISHYHGVSRYHVDICANNEEQAMTPLRDVIDALEIPDQRRKLERFFAWNKECVTNKQTRAQIKGRTNSPKGKDGLRSGMVMFNEIHQYENYANINVFTTGLGKKAHPRRTYATTNGDVRGGVLDDMLDSAADILRGERPDEGMLPFICELDTAEEVHAEANWVKATPSLPYLPDLLEEIRKEYGIWLKNPNQLSAFMTKRMNIPAGDREVEVTPWVNVLMTNRPLIDLEGRDCVAGADYMKTTDFMAARLLFRDGDMRYSTGHAWLCSQSKDLPRIKWPWRDAADKGQLTIIDDVEINPDVLAMWLEMMGQRYNILKLGLDNFRYTLLSRSLERVGFVPEVRGEGNIRLVRPSDQMRVQPVIDSWFNNHQIIWGDDSFMRWNVSNTKLVQKSGVDRERGNFTYGKIEPKSRKNDGFMAFVNAATLDEELGDGVSQEYPDLNGLKFTF